MLWDKVRGRHVVDIMSLRLGITIAVTIDSWPHMSSTI